MLNRRIHFHLLRIKRSKSKEIILTKFTFIRKVNVLISTAKKIDERLIIFKQKDFE